MSKVRVLVTGSRTWNNRWLIREAMKWVGEPRSPSDMTLVHGGCPKGADQIAEEVAFELGWNVEKRPAQWDALGKSAGFVRNKQMVEAGAHVCLAFIDNESKGATHCASLARVAGIPTYVWDNPQLVIAESELNYLGGDSPPETR